MISSVILDEPELEFGGAARHIDPRFGITNYGPADLGVADAPRAIRVGLVGPADQLDGLRQWLASILRDGPPTESVDRFRAVG
ncbi:hypothetical protein OIE75_32960 [Streptomyces sp. NBC_01723]|uniref:hypothetical protein n=1 Tax=Streptomyces sp. NBC_01723 TaxID=2975921 RepID=UPI002E34685C|nr:hypothetical protein [Streptomyces sp. NBC_01723]